MTDCLTHVLGFFWVLLSFLWNVTTLAVSPQIPASVPSPLPSPSPIGLSGRPGTTFASLSPAPSPQSPTFPMNRGSNNEANRGYDLQLAMNDRLGGRSPSQSPPSTSQGSASTTPMTAPTGDSSNSDSGKRKKKQKVVQFWKWTGMNNYMILSEPGFIGLGGGDGKFGLWIHSDLERGHSERCATFDNEPLAAASHHPIQPQGGNNGSQASAGVSSQSPSPKNDKGEFYCQTVEIWSVVL